MIVLFPEFDCFRICRNITMHRPSCIDLTMLCRASTIEQSSIGLAQISHHNNYSREPRSGKLHKMGNPFSHVQTICKNVPNIQGEDITCMTHWQNEEGRLEHSKILQPLRFRCWVAAPLLRP